MSEREWFDWVVAGVFLAGVITAVSVLLISAPYGRHMRSGWGPSMPARLAWVVMETPPVLFFAWVFFKGENWAEALPLIFFGLWQVHYFHRAYIFPFRLRNRGKKTPAVLVFFAVAFNVPNAYLNARWISHFGAYELSWMASPEFIIGVGLFLMGFGINRHSDGILLRLRKPGETGYRIPRGGLFRFVSAPNYLGELLQWLGWAIATWSLAGVAFFLYSAANLVPRAISNHKWYLEKFSNYPVERKAILPGVL